MNKQQFTQFLTWLKEESRITLPEHTAVTGYIIAHGLKPAFFFFGNVDEHFQRKAFAQKLNTFFERQNIDLEIYKGMLIQRSRSKSFYKTRKGESPDQIDGRVLGYPEHWDAKDFERHVQDAYDIQYVIPNVFVNRRRKDDQQLYLMVYKVNNPAKTDPLGGKIPYEVRLYDVLKPLGVYEVTKTVTKVGPAVKIKK